MNELEELRVLLPGWIEHNEEHAAEFWQWAKQAREAGEEIITAAHQMESVNRSLRAALGKLEGGLERPH